ncbi:MULTISPECIES: GlcG/HbpS family heme-binding protein [Sinorhizobium]|uniref:GlcG protein n=1 Tax=Sinorhizobium americanum TaxID=194963 RepID=A0A2S3YNF0_9HYPH|nr:MULTISPECIES: heme-binding protein [Sinorhizobium]PDT33070.1 GlcG protein [Sinorhizobium sp. FG01]PDT49479.1 GlcG protein [Sinorhizobium sp. NG07B]POH30556.1 GlcG protein [Sinorhizobium americanum]POH33312.1 GlcG protein [Sinorhizobium americanum]
MNKLNLSCANAIIERALSVALERGLKPLSIAVLDGGGHLLAFQKQDGASMLRFEIAFGKAYGALAVGVGSRWLDNTSRERPHFVSALTAVSGGKMIPVPGGVLIRNHTGEVIGAVGITGDTSDNDEAGAVVAIEANGLTAQTC